MTNGGGHELRPERALGRDRGLFEVPDDFDAPLTDVQEAFGAAIGDDERVHWSD